jgi:hypothetical protein
MAGKPTPRKPRIIVQREDAAEYLLIVIVSFALTVGLVRFFLSITNYPQIGGGDLHISHVLWGGLLLFAAALALLIQDNHYVYLACAAMTGAGIGLFVDEVGKFITRDYNYFYPAAAPIVYIVFLATLYFYLRIRRSPPEDDLNKVGQALEMLEEDLVDPLDADEWQNLVAHLNGVADGRKRDRKTRLARLLLNYVRSEGPKHDTLTFWERLAAKAASWLKEARLRALLAAGLALLGLFTLKGPLQVAPWMPENMRSGLLGLYVGPQIDPASAPGLELVRLGLDIGLGVLFLAAGALFTLKKTQAGAALGYLGLAATLLTLNILSFYFEQFSAILSAMFQFLVLLGLMYYRRRFRPTQEHLPGWVKALMKWFEGGMQETPQELVEVLKKSGTE